MDKALNVLGEAVEPITMGGQHRAAADIDGEHFFCLSKLTFFISKNKWQIGICSPC